MAWGVERVARACSSILLASVLDASSKGKRVTTCPEFDVARLNRRSDICHINTRVPGARTLHLSHRCARTTAPRIQWQRRPKPKPPQFHPGRVLSESRTLGRVTSNPKQTKSALCLAAGLVPPGSCRPPGTHRRVAAGARNASQPSAPGRRGLPFAQEAWAATAARAAAAHPCSPGSATRPLRGPRRQPHRQQSWAKAWAPSTRTCARN